MEEIDRTFDNQAIMALGIYSFLDNLLARIPSTTDEPSGESTPNSSNFSETTTISNLPLDTPIPNILLAALPESGPLMIRHERFSTHSTNDDSSMEDSTPLIYGVDSYDSDENIFNNNVGEQPQNVEAGGYAEDLFLYLSDKERGEFTCSVCYSIMKDVYQCQNEHRFCYGCIFTWSSGRGSSHECCPMCRCDGLYAKNEVLDERVKNKRVRCKNENCNWLGFLREYSNHEHRYYSPKELNLFSKTLLEKIQKKTCVKLSTINGYDFCDDLALAVPPLFLPQSINSPATAVLEPLQICNRSSINTDDDASMQLNALVQGDSESNNTGSGYLRRSPYTLRPLRAPARITRLPTPSTEITVPLPNLPPLLNAPVLTHITPPRRSSQGQRTPTRTRPNIAYPRETRTPNNLNDQIESVQTARTEATRSYSEDAVSLPLISSSSAASIPRLNLDQPHSRLRNNYQPRVESLQSSCDQVAPQLIYRRLVQPRRGAVLEQLRDTREQLTAMLRLMTIELEERRQNVLRAAASATRLQVTDSHRISESLENRFQSRRRRLDPEIEISPTVISEEPMRGNHNSESLFDGRSFALQHLARLQRIERILNEMHEPTVENASITTDNELQRVTRIDGWNTSRRERLERINSEVINMNPQITELPSNHSTDTHYLPSTRRRRTLPEETRSTSIWSSDDDEELS